MITSDVWSGHGSPFHGRYIGNAIDACGINVRSWCENIDAGSVVGVPGAGVSRGRGTDGKGLEKRMQ